MNIILVVFGMVQPEIEPEFTVALVRFSCDQFSFTKLLRLVAIFVDLVLFVGANTGLNTIGIVIFSIIASFQFETCLNLLLRLLR